MRVILISLVHTDQFESGLISLVQTDQFDAGLISSVTNVAGVHCTQFSSSADQSKAQQNIRSHRSAASKLDGKCRLTKEMVKKPPTDVSLTDRISWICHEVRANKSILLFRFLHVMPSNTVRAMHITQFKPPGHSRGWTFLSYAEDAAGTSNDEQPPAQVVGAYCGKNITPVWNLTGKAVASLDEAGWRAAGGCRRMYGSGPGQCNASVQNRPCHRSTSCVCGLEHLKTSDEDKMLRISSLLSQAMEDVDSVEGIGVPILKSWWTAR